MIRLYNVTVQFVPNETKTGTEVSTLQIPKPGSESDPESVKSTFNSHDSSSYDAGSLRLSSSVISGTLNDIPELGND
jgi:hypothetical protein